MPRPIRRDWPGARHHVMNRGARREPLFFTDHHCAEFLGFVSELPSRFGVLVHAYALMPNHFHLLLESTRGELSRAMGFLGSRYAAWLNATHPGWDGPVFRGRFRSRVVLRGEHWHHLPVYLHLNPVRAGIVADVSQSRWTSHGAYSGAEPIPDWLTTDDLFGGYGSSSGYLEYLSDFRIGRSEAPDGFEQVTFNRYTRTNLDESWSHKVLPSVPPAEAVLDAVARECGVEKDDLRAVRMGRAGNAAKKIAAYWLVVGAGLTGGKVAAILEMHPVRVSQAMREIREKMKNEPALSNKMGRIRERLNC